MISDISRKEINQGIGLKLLKIRQKTGLSQQNIADDLEFSPTTYSKLENGKIDFTAVRIVQLARYFKVYAPDFLDEQLETPRFLTEVKSHDEYKQIETRYEILREMYSNINK